MSKGIKVSSREEIDLAIQKIHDAKDRWTALTAEERHALLNRCMDDLKAASEDWVSAACKGKQVSMGGHNEGEEWVGSFMPVMRNLRLLSHAMKHGGQPPLPGKEKHKNGQWIAKVFPMDLKEKLMFNGFEAEVWIEAGKKPHRVKFIETKTQKRPLARWHLFSEQATKEASVQWTASTSSLWKTKYVF